MASARAKGQPAVGSARWVYDERDVAKQFIDQEVEEFAFSARNEMEWLNEHMAEIFSQNQFNIAEAFKTPSKLRGKTPRTARKVQQSANRAPLTDIFASNRHLSPSPVAKTKSSKLVSLFQVAQDKENKVPESQSPQKHSKPIKHLNADSGYHETTDGEPLSQSAPEIPSKSPLRSPRRPHDGVTESPKPPTQVQKDKHRDTEESFVSAKEDPASKAGSGNAAHETEVDPQEPAPIHEDVIEKPEQANETTARQSHPFSISADTDAGMEQAADFVEKTSPSKTENLDKPSSPSEASSPDRPVLRKKSSLNLASLPPRDPLTTKRSIGAPSQQNSVRESSRGFSTIRDSFLNRNKQSQGPNASPKLMEETAEDTEADIAANSDAQDQLESTRFHNKTSTQRLHERITMLSKSNVSRPSKSIPSTIVNAQTATRKTDQQDQQEITSKKSQEYEDNGDEWIEPVSKKENVSLTRVDDTSNPENETNQNRQPQSSSAGPSYPILNHTAGESTTPAGSPMRWGGDGPLSASKAKFQSFLRSAKGIFASSAAASAQAKMEAMSPAPSRPKLERQQSSIAEVPGREIKQKEEAQKTSRKRSASKGPLEGDGVVVPEERPAKRRSSRLNGAHQAQKAGQASAEESSETQQENQDEYAERDQQAAESKNVEGSAECKDVSEQASDQVKRTNKPIESNLKAHDARRPKQVTKTNTVQKSKPGQFSVLVPSMRPQMGTSSTSVKPSLQQQPHSSTISAKPALNKKASDSSMRTGSSQSVRTGTANSKLKALEMARRKKEQDEREQQRKEEQKKALERKRAEKAEEERQAQERKLAEQRREAEERAASQKRAAEQQKMEKQQREEQLRAQAEVAKAKQQTDDWMSKSQRERPQTAALSKVEKVPIRPESRGQESGRPLVPHINPAKPPKRYFNPDTDDQRPGPSGSQTTSTTQPFPKKQKPSEELELRTQQQPLNRPTMGAPVRASIAKKQELPPKFQHGFMSNASSAQASSSAMLKSAINASHQLQQQSQHPKTPHSIQDIAKFSNARIPFAEAPNPPGPLAQQQTQPIRVVQKTPGTAKPAAKSSPAYPNGDNISLPDIATDSEDEDSDDNAFEAPAWTNSPELRQLLEQQQLVDPLKVFGPIAPLSMEEVFKGASKDRMKRFRDRTSSANWNGPDRLTEEERRKDKEARKRLEKDGGWTYEGSLEAEKARR